MKKYILFSPVGATDPISNFRDGSLLHICRKYKPEAVMLYLSSEMVERQEKDDRYRKCLNLLQQDLDFEMVIIAEERPDFKDVQDYPLCFDEFRALLEKFHDMYPKHEMLLNMASGTPAMKCALYLLSSFLPFKTTLIQTSTPAKSQNPPREMAGDYDVNAHWRDNLDNDKDFYKDRCAVVKSPDIAAEIQKENIRALIGAYEYSAALKLAESMPDVFDKQITKLLNAAVREILPKGMQLPKTENKNTSGADEEGDDYCVHAHQLFNRSVEALNKNFCESQGAMDSNGKNICDEINDKIIKLL